jgi:hypothetical protein
MTGNSPSRKPLHERSDSDTNTQAGVIRVVPQTPPRLLGQRDDVFLRTPLPTHPSHILSPGRGKGKDVTPTVQFEFHSSTKVQPLTGSSGSSVSTTHTAPQPSQYGHSAPGSPILKPKPVPKKRLQIHKDTKTFSLVPQDHSQSGEDLPRSSKSPTLSIRSSCTSLHSVNHNAEGRSNSTNSCDPALGSVGSEDPSTPAPDSKTIKADPIRNSPWSTDFVGGLRKVQKTPDLKKTATPKAESSLPSLPEVADGPTSLTSRDLSTKPSFQSTETTPSTVSKSTNYKIYHDVSASASETALAPPSSSDSNYQLLGDPSPTSSTVYRPGTSASENENYEVHGESSPSASYIHLPHSSKYSQESLIVPPLRPRTRKSSENLGYYKSRSRESLRTGSLTSISTVLSQQEASRAIVASGSLINLPILNPNLSVTDSWAETLITHPLRSHMNEHPHQWSSQLSTVLSVSDGGTDRDSRAWSEEHGRRGSGFPSTPSRHSRQMLSISSSLAQEEAGSRSNSIEPPQPAFARNEQRHPSSFSIHMVEDQDEYRDGITDMQDLRARPSRTRLSGFFSITSSENGRTSTMRSTGSSKANSMLASTIPTWAKLYYGSGERRYLGAPGSSIEGTESRSNSSRTGSPNPDYFPLSIYNPRRRQRETQTGTPTRGSLEITSAPQFGDDGQIINDPYSRRFRTWSMSSMWSPHLRRDRRATRQSIWEPPSINWSTEGGWYGRRNVQIIMFITGFLFPFCRNPLALLNSPVSSSFANILD